ncbi:TraR/DksA C4-type zinc finger protein [Halomonas sp. ISL-60]|uniref:TraR/DksA family transcriptional regulator n=1 Tax=Halomonas sp. ISL-56 TaxID=2819149 RepID=UPI001BE65FC9|nr:TraR/DksA C4-type zinc finger protein [Halomonas sp. ISL-56]MBT2774339.1 TraR/DksA C4-type zinc finger protein [Halomonas sp. ISL-60]MBT2799908.1 TraR/DksA C4-type zinc finger protein [Halomonas sp. ISL-56]
MSANQRKTQLEQLREEVLERIQRYEAHQRHTRGALDKDLEEQALEIQGDDVVDLLDNEARAELAQIEKALSRIDTHVGDRCEVCGELIETQRFHALPYATRCNECAIP